MSLRIGVVVLVLCACIAGICPGIAWGQATNSASVTGSVTDPSGAIIPAVTVTARNLDKNVERACATNDAGVYDTGPLVPGDRYELVFKKDGFATLRRGPMTLRVGATGINAELTLARATQEVVVTEAAPLLETTSSEKAASWLRTRWRSCPRSERRTGRVSLSCYLAHQGRGTPQPSAWTGSRPMEACRFPPRCSTAPMPTRP